MKCAYIRVSTEEQNTSMQELAMKDMGIEKYFIEKVSGKDMNRPKLKEMLEFVRESDSIVVYNFSRLARSTKDLLEIVETLEKKKVTLISLKEAVDSSTVSGKLMITMIGAIAEFERLSLLEKIRDGVKSAKAAGKYKGRKPVSVENFAEHYDRWRTRQVTKVQLAKELGISRQTLYKLFAEYEESHAGADTTQA